MAHLSFDDLMAYTAWDRERWFGLFREHGPELLRLERGTGTDGRFDTVGEMIRHVCSAETRYVQRLRGEPLTDVSSVPADDVDALEALAARGNNRVARAQGSCVCSW